MSGGGMTETLETIQQRTIVDLLAEVARGSRCNSAHEAYAVILEELDELWDEIKRKPRNSDRLEAEALQVAATAFRFLLEIREWREAMGD